MQTKTLGVNGLLHFQCHRKVTDAYIDIQCEWSLTFSVMDPGFLPPGGLGPVHTELALAFAMSLNVD